ncbi:MAG: hypothetical protein MUF24_10070 [Chitinophagaceae bacterium]|nr:hypothetical protein [Chitinophagaceae bacterium]
MQKSLPQNVINFIERYINLNINQKKITTPYFINQSGWFRKPVYAGKGTPDEIESEVKGRIVKVLVEDASPVEYDQPLFLVEPA